MDGYTVLTVILRLTGCGAPPVSHQTARQPANWNKSRNVCKPEHVGQSASQRAGQSDSLQANQPGFNVSEGSGSGAPLCDPAATVSFVLKPEAESTFKIVLLLKFHFQYYFRLLLHYIYLQKYCNLHY